MINLKPLPSTPSRRTEALNHHRTYRKAASKSTLNKTDEHCRSLFNLLPTSFRPRHQRQTSHQKGVDAVSMSNHKHLSRRRNERSLASFIVISTCVVSLHSSIINSTYASEEELRAHVAVLQR